MLHQRRRYKAKTKKQKPSPLITFFPMNEFLTDARGVLSFSIETASMMRKQFVQHFDALTIRNNESVLSRSMLIQTNRFKTFSNMENGFNDFLYTERRCEIANNVDSIQFNINFNWIFCYILYCM